MLHCSSHQGKTHNGDFSKFLLKIPIPSIGLSHSFSDRLMRKLSFRVLTSTLKIAAGLNFWNSDYVQKASPCKSLGAHKIERIASYECARHTCNVLEFSRSWSISSVCAELNELQQGRTHTHNAAKQNWVIFPQPCDSHPYFRETWCSSVIAFSLENETKKNRRLNSFLS